ncbi:tubulin-like doman-containing protein [Arcicella aquatica]|uniref:Tubulin-like doman-containing protein n=1 Tax=Arcicella aquatica TaxID=217141 RepID=A0ABU5QQW5_9BACT|nr:tubulin-like doman-containing protein [Arcicella aquatica]MEA5259150.1 tubulin-like doman-containing protein [Arcicella aquatica]
MARPIIFIGIGTSGLRAVEEAQRFYYYNTIEGERPSISEVKNIFIETNLGQNYESFGNESNTLPIKIGLPYPSNTAKEFLDQGIGKSWIPNELTKMSHHEVVSGAGGKPAMGRLILWGNFKSVYNNIKNTIKDAETNAHDINKRIANEGGNIDDIQNGIEPIIYIVGSLTGGTGSGMFIDIAMMVLQMGYSNIFGLLLLPPKIDGHTIYNMSYGNAYGALKALSKFDHNDKKDIIYNEKWPNGLTSPIATQSPFKFIQFISQSYKQRNYSISTLDGLYKTAGLYLYLKRIGFMTKWMEKYVDAENDDLGSYGTFSLAGAHFPKDDIESYTAIELGINLINRWSHPTHFFSKSSQKFEPINEVIINDLETKRIKNIVAKALTTFDANATQNLIEDLEKYLKKMEEEKLDKKFLTDIFAPNIDNNFYKKAIIGINYAENTLKQEFYDANSNIFSDTESISLVKIALEKSAKAIENIHKFWKNQYGVGSEVSEWAKVLKIEIDKFDINTTHDRKFEQLKDIFELMKKHFLTASLVKIGNYLKSEKVEQIINVEGKGGLPYIGLYSQIEAKLVLLVSESFENNREGNFVFSKLQIENSVTDSTIPYEKVYKDKVPSNTSLSLQEQKSFPFKKAVKDAINNYESQPNQKYSFIDLGNKVSEANILAYLSSENQGSVTIYNHIIAAYRSKLKNSRAIKNYTVTDDLADNKGTLSTILTKVEGPILHINELIDNQKLINTGPLAKLAFVLGINNLETGKVLKRLHDIDKNNPFPDTIEHKYEINSLQNSLFFFRQFANFEPVNDLANIELWKKIYEVGDKTKIEEQEKFMKDRTAYF